MSAIAWVIDSLHESIWALLENDGYRFNKSRDAVTSTEALTKLFIDLPSTNYFRQQENQLPGDFSE
jgi:hypothetical protein